MAVGPDFLPEFPAISGIRIGVVEAGIKKARNKLKKLAQKKKLLLYVGYMKRNDSGMKIFKDKTDLTKIKTSRDAKKRLAQLFINSLTVTGNYR
mgnify:CR=1 FL=1